MAYLRWESYASKRLSGTIRGNLSMYMKSLLRFSLDTVAISTISLLSVNTQRSPEFTLLRLSRQKGHDCDLDRLQFIATDPYFHLLRIKIRKQAIKIQYLGQPFKKSGDRMLRNSGQTKTRQLPRIQKQAYTLKSQHIQRTDTPARKHIS